MDQPSGISEHLRSPQLTDTDGQATGQGRVPVLVAPGRPRWLGYLFYLGTFVVGAGLALWGADRFAETGRGASTRTSGIVTKLGVWLKEFF